MTSIKEPKVNARRQAVLKAATSLFWKYGVKKVSVEEISREAGVSKMTFYKFFTGKTDVARHIFLEIVENSMKKFRELIESGDSPAVKLRKIIELKLEGSKGISREFVMDLYSDPELGLKEYVEKITSESWAMIMDYFRKAQETGVFRKDIKPEFIMYYGQKITEMVTDEGLVRMMGSTEEVIRQLTSFFAYGISVYPENEK